MEPFRVLNRTISSKSEVCVSDSANTQNCSVAIHYNIWGSAAQPHIPSFSGDIPLTFSLLCLSAISLFGLSSNHPLAHSLSSPITR